MQTKPGQVCCYHDDNITGNMSLSSVDWLMTAASAAAEDGVVIATAIGQVSNKSWIGHIAIQQANLRRPDPSSWLAIPAVQTVPQERKRRYLLILLLVPPCLTKQIVGMPNVGKSTLINKLRGESIVRSPAAHTRDKQVARVGARPGVTRQVLTYKVCAVVQCSFPRQAPSL